MAIFLELYNCKDAYFLILILLVVVDFHLKATSTGEGDDDEVLTGHKTKTSAPAVPATPDKETKWSKENVSHSDQKTTSDDSLALSSCIIPINVTGKIQKGHL